MAIDLVTRLLEEPSGECVIDEGELAAASFLARYSGRALDAYRVS